MTGEKKKYKFIHIFVRFPRMGLLCYHTDPKKALKQLRRKIWKQLKHMNNEHFLQYCELRLLEEKPYKDEWIIKP